MMERKESRGVTTTRRSASHGDGVSGSGSRAGSFARSRGAGLRATWVRGREDRVYFQPDRLV